MNDAHCLCTMYMKTVHLKRGQIRRVRGNYLEKEDVSYYPVQEHSTLQCFVTDST